MSRPKGPSKTQVNIRIDDDLLERLTRVAQHAAPPGITLSSADVLRMCLVEALPALEAKYVKGSKKSK